MHLLLKMILLQLFGFKTAMTTITQNQCTTLFLAIFSLLLYRSQDTQYKVRLCFNAEKFLSTILEDILDKISI